MVAEFSHAGFSIQNAHECAPCLRLGGPAKHSPTWLAAWTEWCRKVNQHLHRNHCGSPAILNVAVKFAASSNAKLRYGCSILNALNAILPLQSLTNQRGETGALRTRRMRENAENPWERGRHDSSGNEQLHA